MAALVQGYHQQTGTLTMLQTRPSSAGGMLPPQNQVPSPYGAAQQPRTSFYGTPNNMGAAPVLYRSATAPIQPYAFTSTPSLHTTNAWQPQQQQPQYVPAGAIRTPTTTPQLPRMQSFDSAASLTRINRQPAGASTTNLSTGTSAANRYAGSRDDSALLGQGVRRVSATPRPQSAYLTGSAPAPQLSFTQATPARPSPERYRRPAGNSSQQHQKQSSQSQVSAMPSGSGMASVGHLYASHGGSNSSLPDQQQKSSMLRTQPQTQLASDPRRNSFHDNVLNGLAADDIQLHRQSSDEAKRFRRRSMPSLNASEYTIAPVLQKPEDFQRQQPAPRSPTKDKLLTPVNSHQPMVMHSKAGSSESVASHRSNGSRPSVSAFFFHFFWRTFSPPSISPFLSPPAYAIQLCCPIMNCFWWVWPIR